MTNKRATERPGPFAEDSSRARPTKEQRNNDYATEEDVTGDAAKESPGSAAGPHDKPHLTDNSKTPGAGTLPRSGSKDDASSG